MWRTRVLPVLVASSLLTCVTPEDPRPTEILWDTWGVPHVFAATEADAFRAFGWAQMHSHGDLILRLYGQARGRAAEYWGEEYLDSDRYVRTMGVYRRAGEWYEAQGEEFRRNLDAFAEGLNAYATAHADRIADEVEIVLPVDAVDVLAHAQRVVHFTFVAGPHVVSQARAAAPLGSNAWAIAPSRSASGHAMLLQNPHLPWSDLFLFYEAQITAPGIDAYGCTLVGFPMLAIAFNDHLGWSHTVNTIDAVDLYELTLVDGGYRWDGETKAFETEEQRLRVKRDDGTVEEQTLEIRRSLHGPVVHATAERAVAARVAGLDAPGMLEQWWDMGRATSLAEFEEALSRLQIPMFNVVYADREGHILYVFGGTVPKRSRGDVGYWAGVVPGDTSDALWTEVHPYHELPRALDPETGWLQNANDPPWTATLPGGPRPASHAPYMSPEFLHFRAQQSARLLAEDESVSFEELLADKHSTHVLTADRVLDELVEAARAGDGEVAHRAAEVLEGWDRRVDAESRGAVLFLRWARSVSSDADPFATPWDPDSPLTTPARLRDPEAAVAALVEVAHEVEAAHGSLDVAWGEVHRLRRGGRDLPANGGPGDLGIFRVAHYGPAEGSRQEVVSGDSYYAAIEFGDVVRARVLTAYGNSTQPGSPHVGDQLELFARQEMRPVWRTRDDIEAHLEARQVF